VRPNIDLSTLEEDFAVTPLARVEPLLSALLRWLTESGEHYAVLEVAGIPDYYVQCMGMAPGLHCEFVSNEYLTGPLRLDDTQHGHLFALGWSSASPNHAMHWNSPVPYHVVADRILKTLREVYHLPSDTTFVPTIGARSHEGAEGFVVRAFSRAADHPVATLGLNGPEQDVFRVAGLDTASVEQFLALVPDAHYQSARADWVDNGQTLAWVPRDLSWALPCGRAADEPKAASLSWLPAGAHPIADLSELRTLEIPQPPKVRPDASGHPNKEESRQFASIATVPLGLVGGPSTPDDVGA
jgi:hypothetical protein